MCGNKNGLSAWKVDVNVVGQFIRKLKARGLAFVVGSINNETCNAVQVIPTP